MLAQVHDVIASVALAAWDIDIPTPCCRLSTTHPGTYITAVALFLGAHVKTRSVHDIAFDIATRLQAQDLFDEVTIVHATGHICVRVHALYVQRALRELQASKFGGASSSSHYTRIHCAGSSSPVSNLQAAILQHALARVLRFCGQTVVETGGVPAVDPHIRKLFALEESLSSSLVHAGAAVVRDVYVVEACSKTTKVVVVFLLFPFPLDHCQ